MIFTAHAGHWLVNVAYFVPVVGFLVWLGYVQVKQRREDRRAERPS